MSPTGTTHKKQRAKPYTTGELNRLIDTVVYPLYRKDRSLVDAVLQGLVEKNPP